MKTNYFKVLGHALAGFLAVFATAKMAGSSNEMCIWASVASCLTSAGSAASNTKEEI